jgi:hypothetical protein
MLLRENRVFSENIGSLTAQAGGSFAVPRLILVARFPWGYA